MEKNSELKSLDRGSIELKNWQKSIVETIGSKNQLVGGRNSNKNEGNKIKVKYPKGYGHTFLAAYLSCVNENTLIIYTDSDNLREINKMQSEIDSILVADELDSHVSTTVYISIFEIHYYIYNILNMAQQPSSPLTDGESIYSKIKGKKVIIMDNSSKLSTVTEDWLTNNCELGSSLVLLN